MPSLLSFFFAVYVCIFIMINNIRNKPLTDAAFDHFFNQVSNLPHVLTCLSTPEVSWTLELLILEIGKYLELLAMYSTI